jgi:hypothetical protein
MVNCCPVNCDTTYLNTQVTFIPGECDGLFVFGPDPIAVPGPCGLTGVNQQICPLHVNILENCKGDYKLTLLDDNGCALDTLVLRCSQFEDISLNQVQPVVAQDMLEMADGLNDQRRVFQVNAENLNLVGEYVAFEEAAYFYRHVHQTYLNLWCGAESKGLIGQILENVVEAATIIADASGNADGIAQFVYALGNDLVKARAVALKQLCECGKVCNDQFFPSHTNPCQALRGCCPRY